MFSKLKNAEVGGDRGWVRERREERVEIVSRRNVAERMRTPEQKQGNRKIIDGMIVLIANRTNDFFGTHTHTHTK